MSFNEYNIQNKTRFNVLFYIFLTFFGKLGIISYKNVVNMTLTCVQNKYTIFKSHWVQISEFTLGILSLNSLVWFRRTSWSICHKNLEKDDGKPEVTEIDQILFGFYYALHKFSAWFFHILVVMVSRLSKPASFTILIVDKKL